MTLSINKQQETTTSTSTTQKITILLFFIGQRHALHQIRTQFYVYCSFFHFIILFMRPIDMNVLKVLVANTVFSTATHIDNKFQIVFSQKKT